MSVSGEVDKLLRQAAGTEVEATGDEWQDLLNIVRSMQGIADGMVDAIRYIAHAVDALKNPPHLN